MNPLDLVPKSAYAVIVAMLMATSCSLHWDKQGLVVDISKEKVKVADLSAAIDKANAKSAVESAALTKKVLEAQNAAKKREAVLLADAKSANDALDGLRLSTSQARASFGLTNVPTYASTELTDTSLKLLDQCAERYTTLAAIADQHASDVKTLVDSWPVPPVPSR